MSKQLVEKQSVEQNESLSFGAAIVDAWWANLEKGLQTSKERYENREQAYYQSIEEIEKFQAEYNQVVRDTVQDFNKTSLEILNGFYPYEKMDSFKSIQNSMEQISNYPQKFIGEFLDRATNQGKQDGTQYRDSLREVSNTWFEVTNQILNTARKSSQHVYEDTETVFTKLVQNYS